MVVTNQDEINWLASWLHLLCVDCVDHCQLSESLQHFNFQLMHTTLKNIELLKHFKISKTAPTCFGLQRNHHQGATIST